MRKQYLLIFVFAVLPIFSRAQVKIVFDTDFGGDADDLGALAMLHHLQDKEECELLAVMCWSTEKYAVPVINAVNKYYGHADIPIGVRKDRIRESDWNYGKSIAEKFVFTIDYETAIESTELYRKILSESEDGSIVLVTVGPLANIKNLIDSKADKYSDLNGKELISKKVKEVSMMGGKFPAGKKEWNFDGAMPGVTKYVLENLEVPVTFSGFEVGATIKTGLSINNIDKNTPLYVGYKHFSEHAPWMKDQYKGQVLNNSSFDQTSVLYAVRNGVGEYWDRVEGGLCVADSVGGNVWVEGKPSNHSYLKLKMDETKMAELIEHLMLGD